MIADWSITIVAFERPRLKVVEQSEVRQKLFLILCMNGMDSLLLGHWTLSLGPSGLTGETCPAAH